MLVVIIYYIPSFMYKHEGIVIKKSIYINLVLVIVFKTYVL